MSAQKCGVAPPHEQETDVNVSYNFPLAPEATWFIVNTVLGAVLVDVTGRLDFLGHKADSRVTQAHYIGAAKWQAAVEAVQEVVG